MKLLRHIWKNLFVPFTLPGQPPELKGVQLYMYEMWIFNIALFSLAIIKIVIAWTGLEVFLTIGIVIMILTLVFFFYKLFLPPRFSPLRLVIIIFIFIFLDLLLHRP